ncbi:uncharacterized protein LOC132296242 [Cornus florida]|uniref:uncharacterized protein LOC132296242 n=1 Tax=Cornus florida TaxID=4283 RepID=UPI002898DBF9|nr:uncharacterized protein LOC132296242 [Cornus florida]
MDWSGITEFNDCIRDAELTNLRYSGLLYTRTNKSPGVANVTRKLDRVLVNDKWNATLPLKPKRNLPFKFFHCLADHKDFETTVATVWSKHINGTKMFQVTMKLKMLKHQLKQLNTKKFSDISKRVIDAKMALDNCQIRLDNDPTNDELRKTQKFLLQCYQNFSKAEEHFYHQKARVNWLKDGDQNTMYFMKTFNRKCNRKRITTMTLPNGEVSESIPDIKAEAINHFSNILGSHPTHIPDMDSLTSLINKSIPSSCFDSLCAIPTMEEVRDYIFSLKLKLLSPPDLMDMVLFFFKKACHIVGEDWG